jgi:hypothetical protein
LIAKKKVKSAVMFSGDYLDSKMRGVRSPEIELKPSNPEPTG